MSSSSCHLVIVIFLLSFSYRHPCHVFGRVVIFGSSCHHGDGLSCSLSYRSDSPSSILRLVLLVVLLLVVVIPVDCPLLLSLYHHVVIICGRPHLLLGCLLAGIRWGYRITEKGSVEFVLVSTGGNHVSRAKLSFSCCYLIVSTSYYLILWYYSYLLITPIFLSYA